MATQTLKTRVEIDGEQEYKKALADINSGMKVLTSEMKLVQEQYKGSEDSMEALRAKSDVLGRQLSSQKEKVETLREALTNAARQYGESNSQTQSYQIQLNNAMREELKLEHALEETNNAINAQGEVTEKAGEKMTGLGDTLDNVAGKLGIQIPTAAKEALNGIDGFSVGTVAKMTAVAGAVTAAIKVVKELHEVTLEAAAKADDLLTRAAQTGLDPELIQAIEYAQNFLDFGDVEQSLVKLTNSMDKARDGAKAQAEAFEVLGVSVTNADGQLKNNYDTFLEVIDALGQVENATERDAISNDLFGKSYRELKPLIDAGTGALKQYTDKARENGYVLTNDQLRILGEVDDAHQKLTASIESETNLMAVDYAPAAKAAMELFADVTKKAGEALRESGLIKNTADLVVNILEIIRAGTDLVDALPSWLNPIKSVSNQLKILATIAATVADTVDLISGAMPWNWGSGKFTTALGLNIGSGEMSHLQKLWYSDDKYVSYNASGDYNWRGGLTWIAERGPELVELPQGSRIHNTQETRQLMAAPTDTRRLEQLQGENTAMLREICAVLSAWRVKERMAR